MFKKWMLGPLFMVSVGVGALVNLPARDAEAGLRGRGDLGTIRPPGGGAVDTCYCEGCIDFGWCSKCFSLGGGCKLLECDPRRCTTPYLCVPAGPSNPSCR